MEKEEKENSPVAEDLLRTRRISLGDQAAWGEFVREYSGWVLFRSKEWCESHCRFRSTGVECGLYLLKLRMDGKSRRTGAEECDEGMDIYIWLFDSLRKKLPKYSGRNGSRLSTFVFSVLNSRELYIDWLRWKYGRIV